MGLSKMIGEKSISVLGGIINTLTSDTVLEALKCTAKLATPLIIKGVRDIFNTNIPLDKNFTDGLQTKRQVAVVNSVMGEPVDLIPFEILNSVNTITTAINELINEVGEENVFIDELLIAYFIQKFDVPAKYVDKVYRILENNYAIENKCIRDGVKINKFKVKKKDLETVGGKEVLKQKKEEDVDSRIIDKIFDKLVMDDMGNDKEVKKFILG